MAALPLATTLAAPVEAGRCAACALLWFDDGSSIRLSAPSVLQVFQAIGTERALPGATLRSSLACPRCRGELAFTHDLQRATRFTYWRCPRDRGQLIGFTQFLLEKNFIRPPSAEELAKLRSEIREIACSQCGAPIDLRKDSMCPFCHAPIALIDVDGVAAAVRALQAGRTAQPGPAGQAGHAGPADEADQARRSAPAGPWTAPAASGPPASGSWPAPPGPSAAPSAATLADVQLGAILDRKRLRNHTGAHDLLGVGLAAIAALLADVL